MKKVPVEENLSLVSPSISETLGDFDTESEGTSGKNAPAKGETLREMLPLQKESKAPWVNLFKDNRKPKESLALRVYENLPDRVELDVDDEDDLELTWGHCLIGYFAGRFPGKKALLNLCSSWDVEYEYHTHASGWLVFKFHDEASREKVLKGGPYFVFGRPLLLKVMPKYFRFNDKEISLMPVWVVLPELPLTFWNPKGLGKIASKIGKLISMDNLTSLRGRISYARVLVEIDAAKDLVRTVNVGLPNGDVYDQEVIYEHEPKFCSFCRMFGHSSKSCALHSQEKPSPNAAAQVHKTGTETQPDVLISGTEGQPEGQPLEVEGDDAFIVVERKKKLTAAQKGKQQAKEQVSDSGGKAKAPYKAIGRKSSKLSRSNDFPAKKGRSSLSLDKSKGHTLPLSS
ncbi:zinc ion binding [Abeliophyllum distichum]|uniref:Zinc ion binding n=1 Tax=Abeliophyllum distichum TaxID=126358 RepID=A0ABD1QE67_9LAMI